MNRYLKKIYLYKKINYLLLFQLYYFTLAYLVYGKLYSKSNLYLWRFPDRPVEVLGWLSLLSWDLFLNLLSMGGLASLVLAIIFPQSRVARLVVAMSLFFVIAVESSYGKIIHSFYGWLWSSIILIFLPKARQWPSHMTQEIYVKLYFAQIAGVVCYVLAGVWKIRVLSNIYRHEGIWPIIHSLNNSIAYEHIFHQHDLGKATLFFLNHDYISAMSFLFIVLLQTLSVPLAFMPRFHIPLGVMLLSFHFMSELILNISFRGQTYLVFLQFILWPLLLKHFLLQKV